MANLIHEFQGKIATYFRQLTLATAYVSIGSQYLKKAPSTASVSLKLSVDVSTEPMHVNDLMPQEGAVAAGVSELFHMKAVAAWSDLLNDLFAQFVSLHLNGTKSFPELRRRTTRIDFSVTSDINSQLREGLLADFAFEKYADRVRIINRILNPSSLCEAELSTIKKHVLIRNAVQHHGSHVYGDMLKEIKSTNVAVLDGDGKSMTLAAGDAIELFVPELDQLKGALFRLTNTWSPNLA
jgi:hypothetical protein